MIPVLFLTDEQWEEFISNILIPVDDTEIECWFWTGELSKYGYGQIRINNKLFSAHRLMYSHLEGTVPPKLVVHHLCYRKICVNPRHLISAKERDNYEDNFARHQVIEIPGRCWRNLPKYLAYKFIRNMEEVATRSTTKRFPAS